MGHGVAWVECIEEKKREPWSCLQSLVGSGLIARSVGFVWI